MQAQYHATMTRNTLAPYFAEQPLEQIITANIEQDSLASVFGSESYRHFCDRDLNNSFAYIEAEHATIAALISQPDGATRQWSAFGRLLHTVQDFYAHSNYVELWLYTHKPETYPQEDSEPAAINGLDFAILHHPDLHIGDWVPWRDLIYYIPVLGNLARWIGVPADSHEAMNLDSPARGPRFRYAVETARQRTLVEYARVVRTLYASGGTDALLRFHGRACRPALTTSELLTA